MIVAKAPSSVRYAAACHRDRSRSTQGRVYGTLVPRKCCPHAGLAANDAPSY